MTHFVMRAFLSMAGMCNAFTKMFSLVFYNIRFG